MDDYAAWNLRWMGLYTSWSRAHALFRAAGCSHSKLNYQILMQPQKRDLNLWRSEIWICFAPTSLYPIIINLSSPNQPTMSWWSHKKIKDKKETDFILRDCLRVTNYFFPFVFFSFLFSKMATREKQSIRKEKEGRVSISFPAGWDLTSLHFKFPRNYVLVALSFVNINSSNTVWKRSAFVYVYFSIRAFLPFLKKGILNLKFSFTEVP